MADNVTVDNGGLTDYVVVADEITSPYTGGTGQAGAVKILSGTADANTPVAAGGGVEANALRVTLASDSTGLVSVDDNGGSLTVDSAQIPAALVGGRLDVNVGNVASVNPTGETASVGVGAIADAEATGNGSVIAVTKRLRTLLNAGLPAALGGNGGLKVDVVGTTLPAVVTIEAAYTAAQTDTAIVAVTGANRIVVTSILVVCDNANTVDVGYRVGLGAVNTPTTTGVVSSHPGVPAGGGVQRGDGSGVLGIGAADDDLRITCEVPTGGSIRVVASYYLTT